MLNSGEMTTLLRKEKMYSIVEELWFENSPQIFEPSDQLLSIEGAKVFTLKHAVFANHFPRWFANVIAVAGLCPRRILGTSASNIRRLSITTER
jgi:hypothetical protein